MTKPEPTEPKTKPVCPRCGSPVRADALAEWNVETQQYELAATYDDHSCTNDDGDDPCGWEGCPDWIDVEEGAAS